MSALAITIAALTADGPIQGEVGGRVYGVAAPQGKPLPHIVVSLVSEADTPLLAGAGGYYESRVSVHCHAADAAAADDLGEKVKAALAPIVKAAIADRSDVDFLKAGADVSDYSQDRTLFRRLMDWTVRWR